MKVISAMEKKEKWSSQESLGWEDDRPKASWR